MSFCVFNCVLLLFLKFIVKNIYLSESFVYSPPGCIRKNACNGKKTVSMRIFMRLWKVKHGFKSNKRAKILLKIPRNERNFAGNLKKFVLKIRKNLSKI